MIVDTKYMYIDNDLIKKNSSIMMTFIDSKFTVSNFPEYF